VHFGYMLPENGGFLRVARSLRRHTAMLAEDLRGDGAWRPATERFLETFIRPHGRDRPALPLLLAAIEELGRVGPRQEREAGLATHVVRTALLAAARHERRRAKERRRLRKAVRA